jgi:hypothetical protein
MMMAMCYGKEALGVGDNRNTLIKTIPILVLLFFKNHGSP